MKHPGDLGWGAQYAAAGEYLKRQKQSPKGQPSTPVDTGSPMTETGTTYDLAVEAYRRGDIYQAASRLHSVLHAEPDNVAAHFALAQCFLRLDDTSQAERQLREVVRRHPKHYVASYELGRLLQQSGRLPEAAKAFQEVLSHRQDHAEAHARLDEVNATLAAHTARARPADQPKRTRATNAFSPGVARGQPPPPHDGYHHQAPPSPPSDGSPPPPPAAAPSPVAEPVEPSEVIKAVGGSLAKDIEQNNIAYRGDKLHTVSPTVRYCWPSIAGIGIITLACFWLSSLIHENASSASDPELASGLASLLAISGASLFVVFAPGILIAALVRAAAYRAHFHERCVEIHHGVMMRRKLLIWYYNVGDLSYVRTVQTYLSHTAGLRIAYKEGGESKEIQLNGYGAPSELQRVYHDLQTHLLRERKQFKGVLLD